MRVQVKFFAIFREMTGVKAEWKELAENTTIGQLWQEYAARSPRLGSMRVAYAVNQKLVNADHLLREGDVVGFLPPVSGGAQVTDKKAKVNSARKRRARTRRRRDLPQSARVTREAFITRRPLDLSALVQGAAFPGAGAIVTFSGVVRDHARGKAVRSLEYEAYAPMAEQVLREIVAEIRERWAEARVTIGHRVGRLRVGETSLIIAAAAPHRAEAYAASRYAIERIKASLPVWKKEFAADGAAWVEGPLAGESAAEQAEVRARG